MRNLVIALLIVFATVGGCVGQTQDSVLEAQIDAQATKIAQLETALAVPSTARSVMAGFPKSPSAHTELPRPTMTPSPVPPTSTPVPPTSTAVSPALMPVSLPPTANPRPTAYVIRTYSQREPDGSISEVQEWNDGRYTTKTVLSAVDARATMAPALSFAKTVTADVPYLYKGFSVNSYERFPISVHQGTTLNGYFDIAENKDIEFWIEDPFGKTVYSPGKVIAHHKYSVPVYITGVYNMCFRNCPSCTDRTIGLYYRANFQ